jgi:hypothetical protein
MIKTWQLVAVEKRGMEGEQRGVVEDCGESHRRRFVDGGEGCQSILSIRSIEAGLQRGPRKDGPLDHARKR